MDGIERLAGDVEIAACGGQRGVAEQHLDGTKVDAGFQEVRGECAPQEVNAAGLLDAGARLGHLEDMLGRARAHRLVTRAGRKEPAGERPLRAVAVQIREQAWGQDGGAIRELEPHDLADP